MKTIGILYAAEFVRYQQYQLEELKTHVCNTDFPYPDKAFVNDLLNKLEAYLNSLSTLINHQDFFNDYFSDFYSSHPLKKRAHINRSHLSMKRVKSGKHIKKTGKREISITVPKRLSTMIRASARNALQFMSAKQAECIQSLLDIKGRLTFEICITIVTTLITLLSSLTYFLPNSQLQTIIEQNTLILEANAATQEKLKELTDAITLLHEDLNIISRDENKLIPEGHSSTDHHEQHLNTSQEHSCNDIADPANNDLNVSEASSEPENCKAVEDAASIPPA